MSFKDFLLLMFLGFGALFIAEDSKNSQKEVDNQNKEVV